MKVVILIIKNTQIFKAKLDNIKTIVSKILIPTIIPHLLQKKTNLYLLYHKIKIAKKS